MEYIFVFILAISSLGSAQDDKAPRFSIGLGVLAPSYSQKFAGNGRLDVNQDKNGYSYTLNNVPHSSTGSSSDSYQSQSNPIPQPNQPVLNSGSEYTQQQPHFTIYQHRQIPKQSEAPAYNAGAEDDGRYDDGQYNPPEQHSQPQQSSPQHYQPHQQHQYVNSQPSSDQSYDDGSYKGDEYYGSEGPQKGGQQQSDPQFATYNFEQNIQHQYEGQQPFHSKPYQAPVQHNQQYQSQPSQAQSFQLQPSHHRPIQMKSVPIQARHLPQRQIQISPQLVHALRV